MADKELTPSVKEAWENNQWLGVKGLEIPLNIEPPIESLQSLLEAMNALLDFAMFVLDFVKAFVRNFLNPLLALVKQIITLLKALIQDIRQIGFYFTSDRSLFDDSDKLLGGYPAFERRMLGRLANEEDINRPNFTPQTACLGLYIYGDTAISNVNISRIIAGIEKFIAFFSQKNVQRLVPPPTNIVARNIKVREGFAQPPTGDAIELSWQLASVNGSFKKEPVGGFIIEISTEVDGYYVAYDAEVENSTVSEKTGAKRQRGLVQDSLDNTNLRIFGGLALLDKIDWEENDTVAYNLITNPTSGKVFPLSALREGQTQRTYFVPVFPLSMDNSQKFQVQINYDDLPIGWDLVSDSEIVRGKVAIRVRTVTKEARRKIIENSSLEYGLGDNQINRLGQPKAFWGLETTSGLDIQYKIRDVNQSSDSKLSPTSVSGGFLATLQSGGEDIATSPASAPITIATTSVGDAFRDLCFWAVASAILRGYDVTTANQAIKALMPTVNMAVMGNTDSGGFKNAKNFGRLLHHNIDRALDDAFDRVRCTEILQQALMQNSDPSRVAEIVTLVGEETGLFGNTETAFKSLKLKPKNRAHQTVLLEELPQIKASQNKPLETPILVSSIVDTMTTTIDVIETETMFFQHAVFFALPMYYIEGGEEKGTVSSFDSEEEGLILAILNLLFGSQMLDGSSDWEAFRLFPNGLPLVEKGIGTAINFMESFQETLEGFGKKILKAIAAVEEKIKRIQQIIALINMLLEKLKGFQLEVGLPLHALIHTANGTDELTAKLLSSGLKPTGGFPEDTHAAGLLVVAGGLPAILMELLAKLLVSEEE